LSEHVKDGTAVLELAAIDLDATARLLQVHGLSLVLLPPDAPIPGSYWGAPEAGIIGHSVYARLDTPVHSLLHEACHLIVAGPERRATIHTDASDCTREEDATCCLEILLGAALPGVGAERIMADMDAWGYTFRLGSAKAWFEQDAEDAREFLRQKGLS
jgi:hypothetical protein